MAGPHEKRDAEGFTSLERRFAKLYLVDFNATNAYIAASTRVPKPSRKTAEANGHRLLQEDRIQRLVKAERDRLMNNAELSVNEVMTKMRQMLMYDVRNLVDNQGRPKQLKDLDDDSAAAIVGVKVTTIGKDEDAIGFVADFKLADKVSVLEKAMKYHGLFERDNAQQSDAIRKLLDGGIRIKLVRPDGTSSS